MDAVPSRPSARQSLGTAAALALLLALLPIAPATAADRVVTTETPRGAGSIEEAVANAGPGDRITFADGVNEITDFRTLAFDDDDVTIDGGGDVTLTHLSIRITAERVTVTGLTFDGGGQVAVHSDDAADPANATIRDNAFDIKPAVVDGVGASAIVDGNTFMNHRGRSTPALYILDGSTGSVVTDNAFRATEYGVIIEDVDTRATVGMPGAGNTFGGANVRAIWVIAASAVIQHNLIGIDGSGAALEPTGRGISVQSGVNQATGSAFLVDQNTVVNTRLVGIDVLGIANTTAEVSNNLVGTDATGRTDLRISGDGITTSNGEMRVTGNTVALSGRYAGISVQQPTHAQVAGNWVGTDATGADLGDPAADGIVLGVGTTIVGETRAGGVPTAVADGCTPDDAATPPTTGAGNVIGNAAVGIRVNPGSVAYPTNAIICGNHIGTDADGRDLGVRTGILMERYFQSADATGVQAEVVIGSAALPNTLGHVDTGISIDLTSISHIDGNWIGTDASGRDLATGQQGIVLRSGDAIPPTSTISGNTVSAIATGVVISNGADADLLGNHVGVHPLGIDLTGGTGIDVRDATARIGSAAEPNVIGNQANQGLSISHSSTATLLGNLIGVDRDGTVRPNAHGVVLSPNGGVLDVTIGDPGAPNTIVGNTGVGIILDGPDPVVIRGNHIGGLADGTHLPNASRGILRTDPDAQPAPTDLVRTDLGGGRMQVTGAVTGPAGGEVVVEVFGNPACHPSGSGEGVTPLLTETITLDGAGDGTFDVEAPLHPVATATSTSTAGGTSMFSACDPPPPPDPDPGDGGAGTGDTGGTDSGTDSGGTGGTNGTDGTGDSDTGAGNTGTGGTDSGTSGTGNGNTGTGGTDSGTSGTGNGNTGTDSVGASGTGGGGADPETDTAGATPGGGGASRAPDVTTPADGAVQVSQQRFPDTGFAQVRRPDWVVLARQDVFADAMVGSSLTGNAPLLFTDRQVMPPATSAEVDRLLSPGDAVVLLGGIAAISPVIEQGLQADGYDVVRLDGATRIETALAVADHLRSTARLRQGVSPDEVLLARSHGQGVQAWADAISGGGLAARNGLPILLTPTHALAPVVARWLEDNPGRTTVLGGPDAVSDQVLAALSAFRRIAGGSRAATAVQIAERLWAEDASGAYQLAAGDHPDAWMVALAAAGLAADEGTPLLLTGHTELPDVTAAALACTDGRPPSVLVLGGAAQVDEAVLEAINSC